ncbi:MAG: AAA family ATPase [Byssovorax sp.]
MKLPVLSGIDDFRQLRERGFTYIDRSLLVRTVLDHHGKLIRLSGPPRSGKSVSLSMLRCFFEAREENLSGLFVDLEIAQAGDRYIDEFQRYPVILLRLGWIGGAPWDDSWIAIREAIERAFHEHAYLLDSPELGEREIADYRAILAGVADRSLYESALLDLSRHLRLHHREKVVVLIDDCNAEGRPRRLNDYKPEVLGFYRAFIDEGLKGNPHLFTVVLAGNLWGAEQTVAAALGSLEVKTLGPVDGSRIPQ